MECLFGGYEQFFPKGFRSRGCIFPGSEKHCITPGTEDRFKESVFFASQMSETYHDPQKFRYNLGAFLSSFGSLREIFDKETEAKLSKSKKDKNAWKNYRNELPQGLVTNEYLSALTGLRNVNVHQKSVFKGSNCFIGLFRDRRHKLSITQNLDWDISSPELLEVWTASDAGKMLLDEERSAIGEQYGIYRIYEVADFRKELPPGEQDLDIMTVIQRSLIRYSDLIGFSHTLDGAKVYCPDFEALLSTEAFYRTTVLLESDVDPTLPSKWGWAKAGYKTISIANY